MEKKPTHSVRTACSLILSSNSITEIKKLQTLLLQELERYPFEDQGFLMAMLGFQIVKIDDDKQNFLQFLRESIITSSIGRHDN